MTGYFSLWRKQNKKVWHKIFITFLMYMEFSLSYRNKLNQTAAVTARTVVSWRGVTRFKPKECERVVGKKQESLILLVILYLIQSLVEKWQCGYAAEHVYHILINLNLVYIGLVIWSMKKIFTHSSVKQIVCSVVCLFLWLMFFSKSRSKLSQVIPYLAPMSISGCDIPFSQSACAACCSVSCAELEKSAPSCQLVLPTNLLFLSFTLG